MENGVSSVSANAETEDEDRTNNQSNLHTEISGAGSAIACLTKTDFFIPCLDKNVHMIGCMRYLLVAIPFSLITD